MNNFSYDRARSATTKTQVEAFIATVRRLQRVDHRAAKCYALDLAKPFSINGYINVLDSFALKRKQNLRIRGLNRLHNNAEITFIKDKLRLVKEFASRESGDASAAAGAAGAAQSNVRALKERVEALKASKANLQSILAVLKEMQRNREALERLL